MRSYYLSLKISAVLFLAVALSTISAFVTPSVSFHSRQTNIFLSDPVALIGQETELPDSLEDAAEIAASASAAFAEAAEGGMPRCRVDFDTSVGDETYPLLKTSSEFVQKFVTALCYALIPGLQEQRQDEMMKVAQARAELRKMEEENQDGSSTVDEERQTYLQQLIANGGRDPNQEKAVWEGPKARIYFPDEGNAALARRDWKATGPPDQALVPPCVEFSSCGGVRIQDVSNDMLVIFFCPKAAESASVEELLQLTEEQSTNLKLTVFVNPNLVDMGVTGFGMAGRLLRERLLDNLQYTYYLRTLQWGALTRVWPKAFSVWQEDENMPGGYRLISKMNRLPSNPEVEDIYDIENGITEARQSGGILDQLGDFMQGMMKL